MSADSSPAFATPLAPALLRTRCDVATLAFASTTELTEKVLGLGQERAEEALRLALAMRQPGYNVFVQGDAGSGRHGNTLRVVREIAAREVTPPDLCHVHDFAAPLSPRLLRLPAGQGTALQQAMASACARLGGALNDALNGREHQARIAALHEAGAMRERDAIDALAQESAQAGFELSESETGFSFVPTTEGVAPSAAEPWNLRLHALLAQFPAWRAELREALRHTTRQAVAPVVNDLCDDVVAGFREHAEVREWLDGVRADLLTALDDGAEVTLARYEVNLLVSHAQTTGAPVVYEDNPTFVRLVGRAEQIARDGVLVSDHRLLRAGALQRASGGYLVLDAERLLVQSYAWAALKRALRANRVVIEAPLETQGWQGTPTLTPQSVEDVPKVVLVGDRDTWFALAEADPDFADLFKINADVDSELPRTVASERAYAALLATLARAAGLRPLGCEAIARLIEEAARLADDARSLSLLTRPLTDLMREADHFAGQRNAAQVEPADIATALAARQRRNGRIAELIRRDMQDGTTLISTRGSRAGQVNGLVVIEIGDQRFGHPARISATVRLGDGDVVDIERETELGGAIHSKGVLILSAFLAARYARHQPLSLSASLVFEQSYSHVDGDSASLGELCALLSALADVPIRQSFALTGSVNQFGEVQVIGGVNEKIEGFFDLCRERGLDGSHAVIIPTACVPHLMLREDVVEAARQNLFRIHAVSSVDEAITLLTGLPAGTPDNKGVLPIGTFNHKVAQALATLAAARNAPRSGDSHHRVRRRSEGEE